MSAVTIVHHGDCLNVLPLLPGDALDACITDPPYGLRFMGKHWDHGVPGSAFWGAIARVLKPGAHLLAFGGTRTYHRLVCAIENAGFEIRDAIMWLYGSGFPKSRNQGNGRGTALKPAAEIICLARKPMSEATVAANVLRWGTGALNIDRCRVAGQARAFGNGTARSAGIMGASKPRGRWQSRAAGRWPANVIHDGSDEVLAGFPDSGASRGSAARFFYCAKAGERDRFGSKHPTVKPVKLLRHLLCLVTPPGGIVLDPFAGTGTLASACRQEGFDCTLIECEAEYISDIRRRLQHEEAATHC